MLKILFIYIYLFKRCYMGEVGEGALLTPCIVKICPYFWLKYKIF